MNIATAYAFAALNVALGALMPVILKKVLNDQFPPFTFLLINTLLLGSMAAVAIWFLEREQFVNSFKTDHWPWLILFAVINFICVALFYAAIKHIPTANFQMMMILGPLVTAIFAALLISEPITWKLVVGFFICLIGIIFAST